MQIDKDVLKVLNESDEYTFTDADKMSMFKDLCNAVEEILQSINVDTKELLSTGMLQYDEDNAKVRLVIAGTSKRGPGPSYTGVGRDPNGHTSLIGSGIQINITDYAAFSIHEYRELPSSYINYEILENLDLVKSKLLDILKTYKHSVISEYPNVKNGRKYLGYVTYRNLSYGTSYKIAKWLLDANI